MGNLFLLHNPQLLTLIMLSLPQLLQSQVLSLHLLQIAVFVPCIQQYLGSLKILPHTEQILLQSEGILAWHRKQFMIAEDSDLLKTLLDDELIGLARDM